MKGNRLKHLLNMADYTNRSASLNKSTTGRNEKRNKKNDCKDKSSEKEVNCVSNGEKTHNFLMILQLLGTL